jgi:hypothetical protein
MYKHRPPTTDHRPSIERLQSTASLRAAMLMLVRLINHPHITGLIGTGDRLLGVARDVKYTARSSLGKRVHFAV